MEGFLILAWDLNLPVSGATLAVAGEATLAARWLHEPQSISNQPVWLGFPQRAEQYQPGGSPFSTLVVGVSCRDMERISDPGIRPHPPRVRRDLGVVPRGNSRRALAP